MSGERRWILPAAAIAVALSLVPATAAAGTLDQDNSAADGNLTTLNAGNTV